MEETTNEPTADTTTVLDDAPERALHELIARDGGPVARALLVLIGRINERLDNFRDSTPTLDAVRAEFTGMKMIMHANVETMAASNASIVGDVQRILRGFEARLLVAETNGAASRVVGDMAKALAAMAERLD